MLELDMNIFGNICEISNRLETIGNDFLEDLTTKQWFFLAILSNFINNPPTLSKMSSLMGSSHQNIKQIALKLEKKGFININKDNKDKRSLRISMTKKAIEYGNNFTDKGNNFLNLLYKDFSESDKEYFNKYTCLLLKTIKNIQETKIYK